MLVYVWVEKCPFSYRAGSRQGIGRKLCVNAAVLDASFPSSPQFFILMEILEIVITII
jgi:hypothetical protein